MKFYFSTKKIPQIAHLPLTERLVRMREAEGKLSTPEKFMLNIAKLAILIPLFVFILNVSDNWLALLWALLVSLLYPLLLKPLQYSLCAQYLDSQGDN